MKIQLRNALLNVLAVGETPALAIDAVCRLPEFQGAAIMTVGAKPVGSDEYLKLAKEFVRETGNLIPGIELNDAITNPQHVWLVEVSAKWEVEWEERRKDAEQEELPLEGSTAAELGEDGLDDGDYIAERVSQNDDLPPSPEG